MISKKLRYVSFSTVAVIWWLWQLYQIHEHTIHHYDGSPFKFANHFNIIPFGRTFKHNKGLEYWYDWLDSDSEWLIRNESLTLLHLDTHSDADITPDEIHACAPTQLLTYDEFVFEILELTEVRLDYYDPNKTFNVTRSAQTFGYIGTVFWVIPNHWLHYSEKTIYGVNYEMFLQFVNHQTYYLVPLGFGQFEYYWLKKHHSFLESDSAFQFVESKIFRNRMGITDVPLSADKALRIDICVIPLSALLTNPILQSQQQRPTILDIDLDFFVCQECGENLMLHFGWTPALVDEFNTIIHHFQYHPRHMIGNDHVEAITTLLYFLSTKDEKQLSALRNFESTKLYPHNMTIPSISGMLQSLYESELPFDIFEIRQILHFHYRLQLEMKLDQFNDTIDDFLFAHSILDDYIHEIITYGLPIQGYKALPYVNNDQRIEFGFDKNKVKSRRKKWHLDINRYLTGTDIPDSNSAAVSATVDTDGVTSEMGNDDSSQNQNNISAILQQMKRGLLQYTRHPMPDEFDDDRDDSRRYAEETIYSLSNSSPSQPLKDHVFQIAKRIYPSLKRKGNVHKISPTVIETFINASKTPEIELSDVIQNISNQETPFYDSDTHLFTDDLRNEMDRDETYEILNYPQMIKAYEISPTEWLYHDYHHLLQNATEGDTWTHKYDHDKPEHKPSSAQTTESTDDLTTDHLPTIVKWESLDPIQMHFLRKGNHTLLKNFIRRLSDRQTAFLQWIIFCYFHRGNCADGHSPLHFIDEPLAFGEALRWEDLLRLPQLVSSEELNGLYHLKMDTFGVDNDWAPAAANEIRFVRHHSKIESDFGVISELLSQSNMDVVIGGMELSPAHVPPNMLRWMECTLMNRISDVLWETKRAFVRMKTFEGDRKRTHPRCLDTLFFSYDKEDLQDD